MQSNLPVLLVEDDKIDAVVVQRAFRDLKIANKLICVSDGKEALKYLRERANERPCLILLDLNMPRMNGIEFLKIIKTDDAFRKIPVVVLTTSADQQDVNKVFDIGVAGYLVKPENYTEAMKVVQFLDMYWTLNRMPKEKIQVLTEQQVVHTSQS